MTQSSNAVPIAEGLFQHTADGPRLIGGKDKRTGKIVFPCPASGAQADGFDPVHLSPTGTIWSWTVQRFLPKSPPYKGPETMETFQPYAVAYIELPGEVIVEARLVDVDIDTLHLGMAMKLVTFPFGEDESGNVIEAFGFSADTAGQEKAA